MFAWMHSPMVVDNDGYWKSLLKRSWIITICVICYLRVDQNLLEATSCNHNKSRCTIKILENKLTRSAIIHPMSHVPQIDMYLSLLSFIAWDAYCITFVATTPLKQGKHVGLHSVWHRWFYLCNSGVSRTIRNIYRKDSKRLAVRVFDFLLKILLVYLSLFQSIFYKFYWSSLSEIKAFSSHDIHVACVLWLLIQTVNSMIFLLYVALVIRMDNYKPDQW